MGAYQTTSGQLFSAAQTGLYQGTQTGSAVVGGVSAGLATAAIFDPEPISKAILAVAAGFVAAFSKLFSGCGATCVEATKFADQAAAAGEQIKQQYFAYPAPRPQSLQNAALQAVKQVMDYLYNGCSNPALGAAGQRCISERLTRNCGGCAPGSSVPQWSWCPDGKCSMWETFYDPIANDTQVVPDAPAAGSGASLAGLIPAGLGNLGDLFKGYGLAALAIAGVAAFVLYRVRS